MPTKPLHRIRVRWRLRSPGSVVIGPRSRTALQIEALRDCEVLTVKVEYPGLPEGASVEAMLVAQSRAAGKATLFPEGDSYAVGRAEFAGGGGFGPKSLLAYNRCEWPQDYWLCCGVIDVPMGVCVGVVLRASCHAAARVTVGGR